MNYQKLVRGIMEAYGERLQLAAERLREIADAPGLGGAFDDYFKEAAGYLLGQERIFREAGAQGTGAQTVGAQETSAQEAGARETSAQAAGTQEAAERGREYNRILYGPFLPGNYEKSFADPAYAVKRLGKEFGQMFSAVFARMQTGVPHLMEGNAQELCLYAELLIELYNCMEDEEERTPETLQNRIASFMHDNSEIFQRDQLARLFFPEYDYETGILMEADLSDEAYLYRYGRFVGENETGSAAYLAKLPEEEIQKMADTYTEGYRLGFEAGRKDLSIKTTVEIRYPLGFERMVRATVRNFEKMGLKAVVKPYSTPVNRQYDYDHKEDAALWMDKAFVERSLEAYQVLFEEYQKEAAGYAGPAVIEVFGEEPFSPEQKEENLRYSGKQQQLAVEQKSRFSQMMNQYIHGEERSFTIIAYPVPAIGEQYPAIFAETVKINTLDYMLYRDMQQKLIDVLDTAESVHILGAEGNRTDLSVRIFPLSDPEKETAFENCVADVNIPVGEVFTTPVLAGTNGKLHVGQVYLNGLDYRNLELDFKDGMVVSYTCTNFDDEEKNREYIRDNILMHHETLPMGEFAIGTNTTAFCMAEKFQIADKLPILIAEKTGPHFAVGDTCYTYDEDHMTYNPDGKAIAARDNEISILRKSDISKAYFNCHTDITIPYDELGRITAVRADGSTEDIIRDGRFVVPGTGELNRPFGD